MDVASTDLPLTRALAILVIATFFVLGMFAGMAISTYRNRCTPTVRLIGDQWFYGDLAKLSGAQCYRLLKGVSNTLVRRYRALPNESPLKHAGQAAEMELKDVLKRYEQTIEQL